jgi:isopenicillin-N N-acyltransferase-like protein
VNALDPVLVEGVGAEAGRAYGEQVREQVHAHHQMVLEHLHRTVPDLDPDRLADSVRAHRAATVAALPTVAAEVDGVGEGAGIDVTAAWVLQMRAEVERAVGVGHTPECSAVAVLPEASATGHVLAAQNVDLPPRYAPVLVAVRRRLDERTTFLTITPAGQLAHHGLNSHGVAVLANFVHTAGWRTGVPRYLLSRLGLAEPTCADAVRAVTAPPRAASRTLLVADPATATCLELTPMDVGHAEPDDGYLAHTNHITGGLRDQDTAGIAWSRNSRARLARLRELVDGRRLGVAELQEVLRDRAGVPDALCHRASDDPGIDYATVCSSIADTAARTLWVALGDPSAGTSYTPVQVEPGTSSQRRGGEGARRVPAP